MFLMRRAGRSMLVLFLGAGLLPAPGCGPIVLPHTPTEQEQAAADESAGRRADVHTVADWFTGSFTNEAQAAGDHSYADVRMHTARIWEERQDGIWLYVEQALVTALDRPYRQRVYRFFVQPNGLVVSEIFALPGPSPLKYAGWWRRPGAFEDLSPKSLLKRDGCEVVLKKVTETRWSGGTVGGGCGSDRPGVASITSEVEVGPDGIRSLDRGFDKTGKQVGGPTSGPYEFVRE